MADVDTKDADRAAQAAIRSRANKSISVLEKAFIHNGSGRYFVLRSLDADAVARHEPVTPHEVKPTR